MDMGKGRVLILDDEYAVCRSIEMMVQQSGLESMSVTDATAFFQAVRDWNPTHIILDLVMPGMDGVEVVQQLADMGCTATIAISSGVGKRVLSAAQRSAAEHGLRISDVLPKPFSMSALNKFLHASRDAEAPSTENGKLRPEVYEVITMADVQEAIDQRQFRMMFQPKIDCLTRLARGFEALARWYHPERGLIMPDRFIPLAERAGLIGAITDQVVDLSLQWFSSIPVHSHLSISINVSAKTLGSLDFPDKLQQTCRQYSIPSTQVILEVTETAATDDQLLALDMFTRLRMKGFHVSIDDFGIGNSSLALLARLPFSEIKVDRSFAMTASKSRDSRAIIKSTVDLSHSLDLRVVTEGVEDAETLDYLQEVGCDFAQGYYIARPMSGDQTLDWMSQWSAARKHNLL